MIQNTERLNVKQKVIITDRKAKVHAEMEKNGVEFFKQRNCEESTCVNSELCYLCKLICVTFVNSELCTYF